MGDDAHVRRREFVRRHHPDRGGDPAVFNAGLREFDRHGDRSQPRVVVVPHHAWPVTLILALIRRLDGSRRARRVH
jgi:hypothetical protein